MERFLFIAAMIFSEFMHGCVLIFLTVFTAVKIFGMGFRRSRLIPIATGGFLTILTVISLINSGTANISLCLLVTVPPALAAVWAAYTERDLFSLAALVMSLIFSESVIFAEGNIVYTLISGIASGKAKTVFDIISMLLIYTFSIIHMKLLCRLTDSSTKEPLSLTDMLLVTIPVLIITSSYNGGYSMRMEAGTTDISQIFISSVILLCSSLFVVFVIKNNQTKYLERINHLNEEYLNIQSRHFETAKKNDTAIRKLNHDMRNHVFCLNELYRQEKFEELGRYLADMSSEVSKAQPAFRTGSGIADAIIAEKASAAEQYNVEMRVSGNFGCIDISAYELCTILANLLDNAVEAASYFCVKQRWIEVSCKSSDKFTVLTVRNTTAAAVDVSSPVRTIKRDSSLHGFGLGNVRSAVARVGGDLMLGCEPYEGEFVFTAEVFLPRG